MRLSIRLRLTLWFSIVMAAALTMFGLGVLSLHARWGHAQFDAELADIAGALSRVMQEELGETGNLRRAVQETRLSMEVPGRATAILDARGQPIAARWNGLSADANAFPIATVGRPLFRTLNQGRDGWRVLTRYESSPAGDYVILVGGPLDQVEQQHRLLARVLQVATPLIVLMTAGLSWWVASSALRPITILAGEAGEITARSTDWRLDVPSSADEVGQLARAFNQLLERLGQSLRMQRSFMADASHELRTPVSVIRTAAEVTLGRDTREEGEYREALTVVHQQSARLTRMVEDMLVLARADAEGYPLTRRPLYVDEIVAECVRAATVVAVTRDIRISTARPARRLDSGRRRPAASIGDKPPRQRRAVHTPRRSRRRRTRQRRGLRDRHRRRHRARHSARRPRAGVRAVRSTGPRALGDVGRRPRAADCPLDSRAARRNADC